MRMGQAKHTPFLSIVTVSFNQADFLRQCVDSVVSQKSAETEYIVVDAGSQDGSRDILKSYGSAIDHLILEPDDGPADGLNNGFAKATGEIAAFLNSDDFLLPGAIAGMTDIWRESRSEHYDILLGGAWMVNKDAAPLRALYPGGTQLKRYLQGSATLVQQGMSFRLSSLRDAGGFNAQNTTCWDFELLCAMLASGAQAMLTRQRFGAFRHHSGSLSGGAKGAAHAAQYGRDLERMRSKYGVTDAPFSQKIQRLSKAARHPRTTLGALYDRLLPHHMHHRWRRDARGTGP